MKRRAFGLATIGLMNAIAVGEPTTAPATEPTTRPMNVWTTNDLGRLMLRPFVTAPYPHTSRADGWKNSVGTVFTPDHYTDSTVGIFVPKGYTPGDAVDLVVYFHGHNNHVSRVIGNFKLEEQLAKSGVIAILIVPQGPLDVPDSGGGKLELDEGGFARFVADVGVYLKAEGITQTDRVGTIALAAHSGGYKVTASILHRGGLTDHITDVILLDASYGGLQWFVDFAKDRPQARVVSFHTKHLDDENVELAALLDKAGVVHRDLAEADLSPAALVPAGVTFVSTALPHNDVPSAKDYLALCLQASHLSKRPTTPPSR